MRKIVLGNKSLYLGFDDALRLREMFWPVVGLTNHVAFTRETGFLLWHLGQIFHIGGENWETKAQYAQGQCCRWTLRHRFFPLTCYILDAIDPYLALWQRQVTVSVEVPANSGVTQLGLYSKQYYNLGENDIGEAAFWDPVKERLYHYKGPFWVGIHLLSDSSKSDFVQKECSLYGRVAKLRDGGTRILNHTGEIQGQTVDHGLIDSILGFKGSFSGNLTSLYSLALGSSQEEVDTILDFALQKTHAKGKRRSAWFFAWHRSGRWWVTKKEGKKERPEDVSSKPNLYDVSLKVLLSHCDRDGAVLASLDQDIMGDYRDHYRYVWPRDAAMCVSALCRGGYPEPARRYLLFCEKALTAGGFLWQRYRPDGTRGSGWHPHTLPSGELPIQEDETALSLIAAKDYLRATKDLDFISKIYPTFISKAARFIASYTCHDGVLVKPSYDLWEERRGVFSYTQASCAAALYAAFEMGWALGDPMAESFLKAGFLLQRGLLERLSGETLGFFRGEDCSGMLDDTPDASIFLISYLFFDLFIGCLKPEDSVESPKEYAGFNAGMPKAIIPTVRQNISSETVKNTLKRCLSSWKRIKGALSVDFPHKEAIGIARYTNDWYMRPHDAHHLPGNPWFVTTSWCLWSYLILRYIVLRSRGELLEEISGAWPYEESEADHTLSKGKRFFQEFSLSTGILSEQVHAVTGQPLSCAPLAWSHAAFLDLIHMENALAWSPCPEE